MTSKKKDEPKPSRTQKPKANPKPGPATAPTQAPLPELTLGQQALERYLVGLGGTRVVAPESELEAEKLLWRGRATPGGRLQTEDGEPNQCHANSARLFLAKPDETVICTGYGLTDEVWVQHSWLLDAEGNILETTVPRDIYFGYALGPVEALHFAFSNLGDLASHDSRTLRAIFDNPTLKDCVKRLVHVWDAKAGEGKAA